MRKFWIMAATVALLGFGAAMVSAQGGSSSSDDLTTTAETGTTQTTTTTERVANRASGVLESSDVELARRGGSGFEALGSGYPGLFARLLSPEDAGQRFT